MPPEESTDEKGVSVRPPSMLYGDTLIKFVERDDYVGNVCARIPALRSAQGSRPPRAY